ncbi:MAG: Linoleoyl-CoA desaturase [Bacteroidetes bacterium]|nr:Linoleoyl-CoA desaturase [Bacteroidota bacterium]
MKTTKIKFVNKDKTQFFNVLKERVDNYFIENNISQHANATMVFKTIFMLSLYFVPYAFIMSNTLSLAVFYTCWAVMGFGLAGIGMSVMHDANHGAYSSSPFINQMISLSLTFVGGDNKNWKTQHNILHHTYTNIHGHDRDIDNKVIMRFAPAGKFYKVQRFQVFYVFVFYSIMTLYWTTAKDLVQYFEFIKHGHNREGRKDRLITLGRILFWKIVYIGYIFVLPVLLLNVAWWQVLVGFLILHGIAGLILSVVFQLAHVVEDTTFPTPDANGNIENEWAIHQLETTADFAKDNKLITFYVGGLNYQAIHHLFPRICHVHYPEIAPIVEATAKEFGVPYLYNETFGKALASHIRMIQKLGKRDVTFSAVMNSMG